MARFLTQVMRDFYQDMIAYLRGIGVRIPIAGTNWSQTLGVTAAQTTTDFNDSHAYWDYPWADPPGTVRAAPMVGATHNTFADLSFMRAPERPFFVSEWDQAYPHVWRAESPLAYSLLLTAVGRCENSAVEYNEDRTRQLNYGHAPTLIEAIEAQIGMATVRPNLKVWVISDKGEAVTRLATEYKDGVLHFEIGPQPKWNPSTMVYLIKV